ncbi:MAG: hypothetical protein ABIZ34_00780 [Candidatus Limnocylindrales bacterium]
MNGDRGSFKGFAGVRVVAFVMAIVAAALSVGLLLRLPTATSIWPVAVTPLTYTFLSAYVLAAVAVLLWVAFTGEIAGLAGIGLTTAVAMAGTAVNLFGLLPSRPDLGPNALLAAIIGVGGLAAFVLGRRLPLRDRRLTSPRVRAACLVVTASLLTLAIPLLLRFPDVMPWEIDLDSGALIGCLFLGSAAYFARATLRPSWPDATGPLAALLAYDVVLTLPLMAHIPVARPQHLAVLYAYIAILITSAILGVYLFLIDRRTRVGTTSALP